MKQDFSFYIKSHFYDNVGRYIMFFICILAGILIGIVVCVTYGANSNILKSGDENLYNFVVGDVSFGSLFATKLWDVLLVFIILFLFNITYYTSFLSYIFIGYQAFLFSYSIMSILQIYGIKSLFSVLLFLTPMNILFFVSMVCAAVVLMKRAKVQLQEQVPFLKSFQEQNTWQNFMFTFVFALAIVCINAFIVPLLSKSFIFIHY